MVTTLMNIDGRNDDEMEVSAVKEAIMREERMIQMHRERQTKVITAN